jgi:metallophosphoesterase (TIGR00282 family)
VTAKVLEQLEVLPIQVWTTGNHVWDKKEGIPLLDAHPTLLRPANYPAGNPGRGWCVEETASGVPVAVINLQGQAMMPPIDNPFRRADEVIEEIKAEYPDLKVILVDMHAEATSEKQAIGWYLDGRVTAVLGTHTHVPTADERILPQGTALQTDVGMTGPYDSIIGMRPEKVLERFLYNTPRPFEPAKKNVQLRGALVDADEQSGRALAIRRLRVDVP